MLKLPAFSQKQFPTGESVTVFQDDSQFWRFYLIPGLSDGPGRRRTATRCSS